MDLSVQRQRLLDMMRQFGNAGAADQDSKKNLRDYHHELSVFDNHPADFATEDYMRNLDAAIRENDVHIIALVQNALSRIDRGEYEYCTDCGQKIDSARLEALPYADTCQDCAGNATELGGLGIPSTFPVFHEDYTWPRFNQYGTSDSVQDQPRQVRDERKPD